jgi:UDP-2,3-diacylglucosamine pyrophosphatase LpxH
VVSDLHLGTGEPDVRCTSAAFVQFLEGVVAATGPSDMTTLVLLGDALELRARTGRGARARVDDLAAAHPEVFAALRRCLGAGVQLDIVVGNHDVDLVRPAAAQRLGELLGVRGDGLRIHPWALHVPGVLFAEHGHQHHAVHRLPTLLLAAVDDDTTVEPSPLTAWAARRGGPREAVMAVCRALAAARAAERRAGSAAYQRVLAAEAARLGLRPETARDLWRVSRFRLVPVATATGRRVVTRLVTRLVARLLARLATPLVTRRGGAAHRVATGPPPHSAQIALTLAAHGAPVAWYLCGHTHRAAEAPITGTTTRWANSGTWCSDIRGAGPDLDDPRLFPVVLIDADGDGSVQGGLEYWRVPAAVPPRHTPERLSG